MNYDEFLNFVTQTYGKISIASNDCFAPEDSKVYTAHTEFGLINYHPNTGIITVQVNGHIITQYAI